MLDISTLMALIAKKKKKKNSQSTDGSPKYDCQEAPLRLCLSKEVTVRQEATLQRRSLVSCGSLIFAKGHVGSSSKTRNTFLIPEKAKNSLSQLIELRSCWSSAKVNWSLDVRLTDKGHHCQAMENSRKA